MASLKPQRSVEEALLDARAALVGLRDALTELSLALNDLQFETDVAKRKTAFIEAHFLLAEFASTPGRSPPGVG